MSRRPNGFTLLEMIVAISILGIIAGGVALFIAKPIEGYVDTARRAKLTDMADLALKRMALEIRTAVPNTLRPLGTSASDYIEFIPSRGGGRYCTDTDSGCTALTDFDPTDATAEAHSFALIGPMPSIAVGDQLIIYNTGQTGLDAYNNDNCGTVTGVAGSTVTYNDKAFPYASPSRRVFVAPASGPVRFSLSGGNRILRSAGSAFCGTTPAATSATLIDADSVALGFDYRPVSQANGLLTLRLTLTESGESVTLVHQIHVDNLP